MHKLHWDFETRSPLDVKKVGAWTYSQDPHTAPLCLVYALDDDDPVLLIPEEIADIRSANTKPLVEYMRAPEVLFIAHNNFFESCIHQNILTPRYGYPGVDIERRRCTAAKAAAMSLPRSLQDVARTLRLPVQKDMEGNRMMLTLSKPRRGKAYQDDLTFWEYDDRPEDFEKLYDYCRSDVEVERLVDNALPDLSPREQKIWFLDQEINFRGIQLDAPAIHQTLKFIDITVDKLTNEFQKVTDYAVNSPSQVAKFREWLSDNGCDMPNLQASTVDKRLANPVMDDDRCLRALEIRRALSKISTAKYVKMLERMDCQDGKLRDILLIYAAITKRWGGRGVQLHNMPRGTVDSGVAIDHIMLGVYTWIESLYPDLMGLYSSCIRGMLTASPGNELYVGDFSAIEAMGLAWLAGQEDILELFRRQEDAYCAEATGIYNRVITKDDKYERQVGKVAVLALGYQGGIGAFGTMARAYNVDLKPAYDILWPDADEDEKRRARASYNRYLGKAESNDDPDPLDRASGYVADIIKQRWRAKNTQIVQYWYDLEDAAINAVLTGQKQAVESYTSDVLFSDYGYCNVIVHRPPITYGMMGEHLLCRLPSGNCIVYPFAKVSTQTTPWGAEKYQLSYHGLEDEEDFRYVRVWTYGGKLAENITQAVSRDVLADAMIRVNATGYDIVLHIHDEIVADVPPGFGSLKEFEAIMAEVPPWAEGLPVRVEAWKGKRYKK